MDDIRAWKAKYAHRGVFALSADVVGSNLEVKLTIPASKGTVEFMCAEIPRRAFDAPSQSSQYKASITIAIDGKPRRHVYLPLELLTTVHNAYKDSGAGEPVPVK